MFIREKETTNKKTGKVYVKHTLVESYRTKNGSRQRTIMQLGKVSLPKKYWVILAKELENRLSGESITNQTTFFSSNKTARVLAVEKKVRKVADEATARYLYLRNHERKREARQDQQNLKMVDLNSASTTFYRSLGPELVGHHIWKNLKLPKILKDCGFSERERSLSEAVVLGRLIRPGSDLSTWNWIRNHSTIGELTETHIGNVKKDAVYAIADQLLKHKEALEKHLLKREKELFPNRESLYLFDLTNFYLEGQALKNEFAFYAKSKEKRNDCPLISLALVVDQDGFPVTSRVYEGNVGEPTTLEQILKDMGYLKKNQQSEFSSFKPTMVMDRGIATVENINLLRKNHFPYIVIERCPREKEYADQFAEYKETFERIERAGSQNVWIRKEPGADKKTCRILCMSEGRAAKEKAIADRWEDRAEEDLKRFQSSIAKGSIKAIEKVYQRMGRVKGRYPGFSKRFSERFEISEDKKRVQRLTWERIEKNDDDEPNNRLHGCYVIETTHIDKDSFDIWRLYMTLTRVEAAFRSLKTDLGTRPIFHQLAERTQAHLFLSILAYHILICVEYLLSKKNDHRHWKTIRTTLETHQRSTIMLIDENNMVHHIRKSGQPEPVHQEIYEKLNIKDPLTQNYYQVGRIIS